MLLALAHRETNASTLEKLAIFNSMARQILFDACTYTEVFIEKLTCCYGRVSYPLRMPYSRATPLQCHLCDPDDAMNANRLGHTMYQRIGGL